MTLTRIAAILALTGLPLVGLVGCAPGAPGAGDAFSTGDPDLPNAYVPRGFPGPSDE